MPPKSQAKHLPKDANNPAFGPGGVIFVLAALSILLPLLYFHMIYENPFIVSWSSLGFVIGCLLALGWHSQLKKQPLHPRFQSFQGILITVIISIIFCLQQAHVLISVDEHHYIYITITFIIGVLIMKWIVYEGEIGYAGFLVLMLLSSNPYQNEHIHPTGYDKALSMLILAWFLCGLEKKKFFTNQRIGKDIFWPYAVFYVILYLSTVFSIYPYNGIITIGYLAQYGAILLIAGTILNNWRRVRGFFWFLVLQGGLLAAVGIWEMVERLHVLGWSEGIGFRVWPFDTPPNYSSFYILMTMPFAALLLIYYRDPDKFLSTELKETSQRSEQMFLERLLLTIFITIDSLFIIISYSRISWLGMIAGAIFFIGLLKFGQKRIKINLLKVVAICVVCIILMGVGSKFAPPLVKGRIAELTDPSKSRRFLVWRIVLPIFADYPLFGPGPMTKRYLYDAYSQKFRIAGTPQYYFDAHNMYVEVLTSLGLMGMLALLLMFAVSIRNNIHNIRSTIPFQSYLGMTVFTLVVIILIDGIANFRFWLAENGHLVFLVLSLGFMRLQRMSGLEDEEPKSPVYIYVFTVIVLIGLLVAYPRHFAKIYTNAGKENSISNPQEAERMFERATILEPLNAHHHFFLASFYQIHERFNIAIKEMETAIQHNPNFAIYHYQLGLLYSHLRRFEEAMHEFNRAIELEPWQTDGIYYRDRAQLAYSAGAHDMAAKDMAMAILLRSSNFKTPLLDRDTDFRNKVIAEMERYVEKPIESTGQKDIRFSEFLVHAYLYMNMQERALAVIDRRLAEDDSYLWGYIWKARILQRQNQFDEAKSALDKVILITPGLGMAYADLGIWHFHQQNYVEARLALERAVTLKDSLTLDSYLAHYFLEKVYFELKLDDFAKREKKRYEFIQSDISHQMWDTDFHFDGANWDLQQLYYYGVGK